MLFLDVVLGLRLSYLPEYMSVVLLPHVLLVWVTIQQKDIDTASGIIPSNRVKVI